MHPIPPYNTKGDWQITGVDNFEPTSPFNIGFIGAESVLNATGSGISFKGLSISQGSRVQLEAEDFTLKLGTAEGGGLFLAEGSELILGENTLAVVQNGALNPENHQGRVGFSNGSLTFDTQTGFNSNLYLVEGMDMVRMVEATLTGAGVLEIRSPLYVYESLTCSAGTIFSNGFLHMMSMEGNDSRIGKIPAGAAIGDKCASTVCPDVSTDTCRSVNGYTVADL